MHAPNLTGDPIVERAGAERDAADGVYERIDHG